jgi:hypothetical protein
MNRPLCLSLLLAVVTAISIAEKSFAQLTLRVDSGTGAVQILNDTIFPAGPVTFNGYLIKSASGQLNPDGWFSLHDQGLSGWSHLGDASPNLLGELNSAGGTELAIGQSYSIGNVYNPFPGIQDLEFEMSVVGGTSFAVPVIYVGDTFPPIGIAGDYNMDGIVSHADYSVLGDAFGSSNLVADGNLDGVVDLVDYEVYRANFGSTAAFGTAGSASSFESGSPLAVVPTTTPEGNTEWTITVEGVPDSLAGQLNIVSSQSNFLSATGGGSMLDNGTPPAGVPGRTPAGGIEEGVFFESRQAFAALGSTLGAPSPGQNREFITLVTEGDEFTTLSISGEFGYQGVTYFVNNSFSFGPGSTPDEPVLPNETAPGEFIFQNVPSGAWVDPPLVDAFEYVMDSASLFTAILDFPPGFAAEFAVTAENTLLGEFGPGDSVDFVGLLGHGVESFIVSNITPLADAADPNAFPLKLEYSTATASFRMLAVPEPGTIVLALLTSLTISSRRRRANRG